GTVCVVGKIRDLILQLSKSSIYSTKPIHSYRQKNTNFYSEASLSKTLFIFLTKIKLFRINAHKKPGCPPGSVFS
ncbi:hypothetical protein N6H07_20265, partial [Enterobacter cloacae]|uniref:hypothetical protein n=1 Tax=Enterobacter cloacae TaxID=550 RepID=UPI0021C04916